MTLIRPIHRTRINHLDPDGEKKIQQNESYVQIEAFLSDLFSSLLYIREENKYENIPIEKCLPPTHRTVNGLTTYEILNYSKIINYINLSIYCEY